MNASLAVRIPSQNSTSKGKGSHAEGITGLSFKKSLLRRHRKEDTTISASSYPENLVLCVLGVAFVIISINYLRIIIWNVFKEWFKKKECLASACKVHRSVVWHNAHGSPDIFASLSNHQDFIYATFPNGRSRKRYVRGRRRERASLSRSRGALSGYSVWEGRTC